MTRTRLYTLLFAPLLMVLQGCQPDAPPATTPGPTPTVSQPVAVAQPSTGAVAQTGSKERELAQKSGCFACHALEKKLVGPAWIDVSAKYRGQKDAEAKLVAKVSKGGSGVWGSVPMPPNSPKVSETDIKVLVRYILSMN